MSDNNRKVTLVKAKQPYVDHPERFDFWQLLCGNALTGRCYWEVEWKGGVRIAVSYRRIRRKGKRNDCKFGENELSWRLSCSDGGYSICHGNSQIFIPSSSMSHRVAVYVDCPAGILSFCRVSSDTQLHLYTFSTTFTEPLYAGFGFSSYDSSVSLCSL